MFQPKVSYFFSPGKVHRSFIHSNLKMKREKKIQAVFFLYGKCSSVIHTDFEEIPFFLQNWLCFYFLAFLCGFLCFFFHGKVHMSFIHSIFEAGKKTQTGKKNSFFIHSFDIPQKCAKTNFSGEIKKYGTLGYLKRIFLPTSNRSLKGTFMQYNG